MPWTQARQAPLIMGVVNVTPDSFSDGGRFHDPEAAVAHARGLIAAGADMLDIGGESTRPGAQTVPEAEEIRRVVPVIEALVGSGAILSIDTRKPGVARAAVAAGATIWNDVTALSQETESPAVAAELGCDVVLMHMKGSPATMQDNPAYEDVVGEVCGFLARRAEIALAAGVARERIALDPGIGFGKRADHSLTLIRDLDRLVALGFPVLLGVSRKRFVRAIDPTAEDPNDRIGGSLASALWGASKGAAAVRVHDVRETAQALAVWRAIERGAL